jgi:anti-sigma B factor antagonist
MTITQQTHGRVIVVSIKGNLLGEPETTELREAIYGLTERVEKQVVLDLGGLKAINSTGLGTLVAALTSVRRRGGDMCLARLTDKVDSLLMITNLNRVFRIYETVERAVTSFQR